MMDTVTEMLVTMGTSRFAPNLWNEAVEGAFYKKVKVFWPTIGLNDIHTLELINSVCSLLNIAIEPAQIVAQGHAASTQAPTPKAHPGKGTAQSPNLPAAPATPAWFNVSFRSY